MPQVFVKRRVAGFVADDRAAGIEFESLLRQEFYVSVSADELDLEKVSMLSDDIQGLSSYGTRGTQNGDFSFYH